MTQLEQHYKAALEKIAKLNCRSCEDYVAKADLIAVDALVMGETLESDLEVERPQLPKAA